MSSVTKKLPTVKKQLTQILLAASLAAAPLAWSANWEAGITQSTWQASEPSSLNCQLTHVIPNFGMAIFNHRSGDQVKLSIKPFRQAFDNGKVELVALAPQWQPGLATQSLGSYTYRQAEQNLNFSPQTTEQILASLYKGLMPSMLQEPAVDSKKNLKKASLTPVNFHQAFAEFQTCQAQLLPTNYEQIKKQNIYFVSGGANLSDKDKQLLDKIVHYVFADDEVVKITLDGHSDALGTRKDNRQLSSQRADAVTDYLIARGVPEDKIQTQYHGQRYPIASNATVAGRGKNRRVEIELVKRLDIDPLY